MQEFDIEITIQKAHDKTPGMELQKRIFKESKIKLNLILYITTMNYKNQYDLSSILFPFCISFYKPS